jgi:hypothetical protein
MMGDDRPDFAAALRWRLAPLQDFDPRRLVTGDDALDAFVLSLALAYNDLKAVQWMNFMLEMHHPPQPEEISPDAGQWNGMRVVKRQEKLTPFRH